MSYAMEYGPRPHRITVDEFIRMDELGLLAPDARVELIEGVSFRSRTDVGYREETTTKKPGLIPLPSLGLTVDLAGLTRA